MNRVALYALPLLLVPVPEAFADIEIKARLKHLDGQERSEISYADDGSFDERDVKRKSRWESETLVTAELNPESEWRWSARLGYNARRTVDHSREYREDGSLKNDKTRTEWRQTPLLGLGLRRDLGSMLGGAAWSLRAYHDRFIDVHYRATSLAEDAKPIEGRGMGYETKLALQAEYPTPWYSLYLLPKVSIKHEQYSAWTNTARDDREKAEQELQYEARLWLDWIMPVAGWEMMFGPTWQLEDQAERKPGEAWEWENQEQWIGTLRLEYESPMPGFEMEIGAEHWLNGADRDDTRYRLELSYEF
ncbi:hypothetical protein ACQUQP_01665 [Marinobacterium sp. YM272]|uniref:hypothetical protein n=1 Tax=Marinobacterium sp. YM272 TaxID=3421654 RepID=UPI003D7FCA04